MDKIGHWTIWKLDIMDIIGQYGQNWNLWTKKGKRGQNWTIWTKKGKRGQNWTIWTKKGKRGQNWTLWTLWTILTNVNKTRKD